VSGQRAFGQMGAVLLLFLLFFVVTGEGWDSRYWRPGISPSRQFYSNITSPQKDVVLIGYTFIYIKLMWSILRSYNAPLGLHLDNIYLIYLS
jgi:hypothetical protein